MHIRLEILIITDVSLVNNVDQEKTVFLGSFFRGYSPDVRKHCIFNCLLALASYFLRKQNIQTFGGLTV